MLSSLRSRNRYLIYRFNSEFADVLAEFLEVAIHQIMYVREVYPRGTPCVHYKLFKTALCKWTEGRRVGRVIHTTKEVRHPSTDE
jgi:hypothetical protein